MHDITIGNYKGKLPATWDELNRKQLFTVIRLFLKGGELARFRMLLIMRFLKMQLLPAKTSGQPAQRVLLKRKVYHLSTIGLTQLANTFGFLTKNTKNKNGDPLVILNSRLTLNLMPQFRHRCRRYYGPDQKLFNINFDEFLEAMTHYSNFTATGNTDALNKLTATLYRPKDKTIKPGSPQYKGDIRQPFNSALVPLHARRLRYLSFTKKLAAMLFFEGSLNFIDANFPHVLSGKGSGTGPSYGPLSLIDALSGEDVTKNDTIRQTALYDVLVRLENAYVKNENSKQNT